MTDSLKMKIEASVVIDRPVEEVWTYATDLETWPQWHSSLNEMEVTSESQIGVGTTFHQTGQAIGQRIEHDSEITECEPPHKWCYQSTSGPFPFEAGYTFESVEGGTRVTLVGELDVGGFFKLAEPLVARQMRRTLESDLHSLKDILSTGSRHRLEAEG
jgi:uncharacterized membrane protein